MALLLRATRNGTLPFMDDFLKMDIFFAVATAAVVVVAVLISLAILRILRILTYVERVSETVSDEAERIRADIDEARANIRKEGFKMAHLMRFVRSSVQRFFTRRG